MSFPIEKIATAVQSGNGEIVIRTNVKMYVLAPGDVHRADDVNGNNDAELALFLAGETLLDVFDSNDDEVVQPIYSQIDGSYPYWVDDEEADLYIPTDTNRPITPVRFGGGGSSSLPISSVDGVSAVVMTPSSSTQSGYVVKAPNDAWGDGTDYGEAQAFMLLREDYVGGSELEPDRNVLFRVNGRDGGIGTAGGIHVAYGFRQHADWAPSGTGAVWIQMVEDDIGLFVTQVPGSTDPFIKLSNSDGSATLFQVSADGSMFAEGAIVADSGDAGGVFMGDLGPLIPGLAGKGGLIIGSAGDTNLYREAANVLKTDDAIQAEGDIVAQVGNAEQTYIGDIFLGSGTKAGIAFGSAGDTNLYRDSANVLKSDDTFQALGDMAAQLGGADQVFIGDVSFGSAVAGIAFGSAADAIISRTAANELTLATGDTFRLGSGSFIHMGNAANVATTVGAAGGASALPATPLGYFIMKNPAGTNVKVPYYTA